MNLSKKYFSSEQTMLRFFIILQWGICVKMVDNTDKWTHLPSLSSNRGDLPAVPLMVIVTPSVVAFVNWQFNFHWNLPRFAIFVQLAFVNRRRTESATSAKTSDYLYHIYYVRHKYPVPTTRVNECEMNESEPRARVGVAFTDSVTVRPSSQILWSLYFFPLHQAGFVLES